MSDEKQGMMYQLGDGPVPVPLEAIGRWREAGASPKLAEQLAATEVRIDSVLAQILRQFNGSAPASEQRPGTINLAGLELTAHEHNGKIEELSRAVLELQRVLCWPEEERLVPSWTGAMRAGHITDTRLAALEAKVAEHGNVLDAGTINDTMQLLALLRANGVTRYGHGDLEIELGPDSIGPSEEVLCIMGRRLLEQDKERYQKAAHYLWELLDRIAKSGDAGLAARRLEEATVIDGRLTWRWEEPPGPEPEPAEDDPETRFAAGGIVLPSLDELRQKSAERRQQQQAGGGTVEVKER